MGTLYIIPTPIGNLEDITFRAVRILKEIDALACEDTRVTRRLLSHYEIKRPSTLFSYHEHNEEAAGKRIMGLLEAGQRVGLCTDRGTPGISDPGYRIISQALDGGHDLEVLPGASAALTGLLRSGLPTSSFTFKGFPPRKTGPRKRFIEADKEAPHTLIFFESPHRIGKFLMDAFEVLGNRSTAVTIELSKKFERVHQGPLADLAAEFQDRKPKGEITIVIAGNHPKFMQPL